MRTASLAVVKLVIAALIVAVPVGALTEVLGEPDAAVELGEPEGSFEIVGHEPLGNRGMNAALAVHGDYAYVGSRTDGKADNANGAGILIVDTSDPTDLSVVGEMSTPDEGNAGQSARELRVWESQEILIALHTNCSALIHVCSPLASNGFKFYDISGDKATAPELIAELTRDTHEFYLWQDPADPDYALMYGGSAQRPMQVWDLSTLLDGQAPDLIWQGNHPYTTGGAHSLSVSNDGTTAYVALLTGGFAVMDVSGFADRVPGAQPEPVTEDADRPRWPGPGAHSAVKLFNSDFVYVSDEVYGDALKALGEHGCPWGWARMIDISDPTAPTIEGEFRIAENMEEFCFGDLPRPSTSFSAHNPTQTQNIVFSSWHSGGMQAIDVSDPANPTQLAELRPEPLPFVTQEDPALSVGLDRVVMWSYPIIKDGIIYVTDLRNGLYALRYTGPYADEVDGITFLEGNSNLGDALCFEPVVADDGTVLKPDHCED